MLKLAILVSGGGSNLQAIMDKIHEGELKGVSVEVVISDREDVYALTRAKNDHIKTATILKKDYSSREEFDDGLLKLVDSYKVDLIVLAGFLTIIPKDMVKKYENRIINVHPSLIPSFCGDGFYGIKVHEEAIARGVKITGATVHFVDEGTDTGPIILQKAVAVNDDDDPKTLQKRVMEEAEWEILPQAIALIAEKRL